MDEGENKSKERCSYCNFPGHTKRSCLVYKSQALGGQKSRKGQKDRVSVRVFDAPSASPHILNLREEEGEKSKLLDIEPYIEKPAEDRKIETVDFADMVRSHGSAKSKKIKKQTAKQFFQTAKIIGRHMREALPTAIAAFLIIALPIPTIAYYKQMKQKSAEVVAESANGFLALQSSTAAALRSDFDLAEADLTRALRSFSDAQTMLQGDQKILMSLMGFLPFVGPTVEGREHLLSAGHDLAIGNEYVLKGIGAARAANDMAITDRLEAFYPHIRGALAHYRSALARMDSVSPRAIPPEYQKTFEDFRTIFASLVKDVSNLSDLISSAQIAFGRDSLQRYLIVFQNENEIRPTGGFIGSYAIMDVQKGKILKIDVPPGGTYDLQGQLTEYVKPPLPLQLVNGRWEFQDSNWFPDFAASAEKMAWFYQHGRGATVDGVIAINASVLERVLRVLGAVELQNRALTIQSGTAIATLQNEVEYGEDKATGKPKAILAELTDGIVSLASKKEPVDILRLLVELHEALQSKEIQLYFANNDRVQETLRDYGWTGEIATVAPNHDYLAVFNSNFQGQKSDARINQVIEHQAVVADDGSVTDTVVIRRTHSGRSDEDLYGAQNISYARVYVPLGSELIDAGGFQYPPEQAFHAPESWYKEDEDLSHFEKEKSINVKTGTRITEEFGKTAFGNWIITPPGEISVAYVTYKLPFRVAMEEKPMSSIAMWQSIFKPLERRRFSQYSILVQKQSGTQSRFISSIMYPSSWMPIWKSDEQMDLALNGAAIDIPLKNDTAIGVLMQEDQKK